MKEFTKALQGEKPIEEKLRLLKQARMSNSFKSKLIDILHDLNQDRMALLMKSTMELSPAELIENLTRIESFVKVFTDYWLSMDFDALISPAGCLPAIPHKLSSELFCLNAHFMLYNILDFPAGVVPVKLV